MEELSPELKKVWEKAYELHVELLQKADLALAAIRSAIIEIYSLKEGDTVTPDGKIVRKE